MEESQTKKVWKVKRKIILPGGLGVVANSLVIGIFRTRYKPGRQDYALREFPRQEKLASSLWTSQQF